MTLTDTAYLKIDDGDGTTATFEFGHGLEISTDIDKSYLMGERGQYLKQIYPEDLGANGIQNVGQRRMGYWIDGGAGNWDLQLSFETGLEDVTWGDGGNDDATDASGSGVHAVRRKDVLAYWLTRTRTDSFGQARLHHGEWTDGTVAGSSGGAYNQPMPVAVRDATLDTPEIDSDVNTMSGTITMNHVALFPTDAIPDWVSDPIQTIREELSGVGDR